MTAETRAESLCMDRIAVEKHALMWDHPSATSSHLQKTECGRFVPPQEIGGNFDQVTCPACKAAIDTYQALEV